MVTKEFAMKVSPLVKAMTMAGALSLAVVSAPFAQQGPGTGSRATANNAPPGAPRLAARLLLMDGDVLASTASGLVAVSQGAELPVGTRVMTMARSHATIQYPDGCIVTLKPNMRVEIRTGPPCEERQVLARSVVPDPAMRVAVTGAPTPPTNLTGLALAGDLGEAAGAAAGIAGIFAIVRDRSDGAVSPN